MRFLHVADLHIGKRMYGVSLAEDQRHILSQVTRIIREEQVDALVIAGDIYDKAAPSAEAVGLFDAFLQDVADAGCRVIGIPGNHDSAERIAYAQGLLRREGVFFPPVYDGVIEPVVLHDEQGPVNFWPIPFLRPGDVRRHFPEVEIDDDYSAALHAVVSSCAIDESQRNIAVAHQFVVAAGWAPDRADDEISLGGLDAVDMSVFAPFDYVALGHVHRSQRVGRDTVRYAGSPLKYSFSEARYGKSALLVDVGPKDAAGETGSCISWRSISLVPLHDVRELKGTLLELLAAGMDGVADDPAGSEDATAQNANVTANRDAAPDATASPDDAVPSAYVASAHEDYLHLTLTDEHPQLDAMTRVREVYPNALALDYERRMVAPTGERVSHAADPAKMSLPDLFARFFQEQMEKELDDEQQAMVEGAAREVSA